MTVERKLTDGEKLAGVGFNPSSDPDVDACKQEFAAVIDRMLELQRRTHKEEVVRMCSIAITQAQTAQMWAVKAITWKH